ncbi:MAG TPA: hypothetical protein VIJ51_14760 [Solirubrobacteraceae bacterium]
MDLKRRHRGQRVREPAVQVGEPGRTRGWSFVAQRPKHGHRVIEPLGIDNDVDIGAWPQTQVAVDAKRQIRAFDGRGAYAGSRESLERRELNDGLNLAPGSGRNG